MPTTVTISEAAALTGLSKTAVRRRVERGSLPAVVRDGVRRIPVSELERQGLLASPGPAALPSGDEEPEAAPAPGHPAWGELLDRLVAQERELAGHRLLAAQAESLGAQVEGERRAREAAEAALHEARARVRALEARLARPVGRRVAAHAARVAAALADRVAARVGR
jgi:excisionase family DNA binding protein